MRFGWWENERSAKSIVSIAETLKTWEKCLTLLNQSNSKHAAFHQNPFHPKSALRWDEANSSIEEFTETFPARTGLNIMFISYTEYCI